MLVEKFCISNKLLSRQRFVWSDVKSSARWACLNSSEVVEISHLTLIHCLSALSLGHWFSNEIQNTWSKLGCLTTEQPCRFISVSMVRDATGNAAAYFLKTSFDSSLTPSSQVLERVSLIFLPRVWMVSDKKIYSIPATFHQLAACPPECCHSHRTNLV